MSNVTSKQLLMLKELIKAKQKGICQDDSKSRYICEKFVEKGLAYKNQGTRHHQTVTGSDKYVSFTYYTAAPEAHRLVSEALAKGKRLMSAARSRTRGLIRPTRSVSVH